LKIQKYLSEIAGEMLFFQSTFQNFLWIAQPPPYTGEVHTTWLHLGSKMSNNKISGIRDNILWSTCSYISFLL